MFVAGHWKLITVCAWCTGKCVCMDDWLWKDRTSSRRSCYWPSCTMGGGQPWGWVLVWLGQYHMHSSGAPWWLFCLTLWPSFVIPLPLISSLVNSAPQTLNIRQPAIVVLMMYAQSLRQIFSVEGYISGDMILTTICRLPSPWLGKEHMYVQLEAVVVLSALLNSASEKGHHWSWHL